MKNNLIITVLFLSLIIVDGCQYFKKDIPNKEDMLKNELQKVNWENVDELPTISYCDSINNVELQQSCFFDYFKHTIEKKLNDDSLKSSYPLLDSLKIKVTIFPNATLGFKAHYTENNKQNCDTIKVDSIVKSRLVDFSNVQPAIKRGMKVKTEFYVPVLLK